MTMQAQPSVDAIAIPVCAVWVGAALMVGGATMRWMTLDVAGSSSLTVTGLDRADETWRIADIPDGWFVIIAALVAVLAALIVSTRSPRRSLALATIGAGAVGAVAGVAAWLDFAHQRDQSSGELAGSTNLAIGPGLVTVFIGAAVVGAAAVWLALATRAE